MLAIILTVLKMIGIIVLVLLGLLLLLLLLFLFVPVRYRAKGIYKEKEIYIQGRATWLLHSVSALAAFEQGQKEAPFYMRLKILGIPVLDSRKPKRDRNKKVKKSKNKKEKDWKEDDVSKEIQTASVNIEEKQEDAIEVQSEASVQVPYYQEEDELEDTIQEKSNYFQKIKIIYLKFVNFFKNIKFTFQKICDTIRKIKSNIKYYLHLLQLDSTKQAFAVCKKQLGCVLKRIVPKKYNIKLHLGFEDPAIMGEILAVWGMLYPFHQGAIDIQPEFEQAVIEGDFYFKGHIRFFTFVRAACICFFDKNIKQLIKHLRKS